MAKLIVARGEIHQGAEVVARQGEEYTTKNPAEEKRLLARGVLVAPQSHSPKDEPEDPEAPKEPTSSGRGGKKAAGDEGGAT